MSPTVSSLVQLCKVMNTVQSHKFASEGGYIWVHLQNIQIDIT